MEAKKDNTPPKLEPIQHYQKYLLGIIHTYDMKRHLVYDEDAILDDLAKVMRDDADLSERDDLEIFMIAQEHLDLVIKRDLSQLDNRPLFLSRDKLILYKPVEGSSGTKTD